MADNKSNSLEDAFQTLAIANYRSDKLQQVCSNCGKSLHVTTVQSRHSDEGMICRFECQTCKMSFSIDTGSLLLNTMLFQ